VIVWGVVRSRALVPGLVGVVRGGRHDRAIVAEPTGHHGF
jgi:hypothetical protein